MKNLNELFKKKLAEQQFDGKEKYWAQLDKKLTEHAQEKVVIAWYKKWLLPVIAIVTVGLASLLYNTNTHKSKDVVKENSNQSSKNQSAPAPAIAQNNVNPSAQVSNTSSNNQIENIENKVVEVAPKSIMSKKSVDDSNISNSSLKSTQTNLKQKDKTNTSDQLAKNVAFNSIASNSLNPKIISQSNQTLSAKEPELSHTDYEEAINSEKNVPENEKKNLETNTHNLSDENILNASSANYKGLDFSQVEMPLAYLSPKALTALIYPTEASNITPDLTVLPAKKSKLIYSLSVYSGAMYSMKNMITQDGNTADYLSRRNTEEMNSFKPNAGIDVELKRGHWTLTSGLNFHQQGEKRNYSDQFKRTVPYDSLVININNNSAWILDSTSFYALQYNSIITSQDTTITYYDETTGTFFTASVPMNVTQSLLIDTNYFYHIDSTYHQAIDTIKTNYTLKKQILVKDPNQANLKGRNTFSYVEIPVLIGYEWGIRRWRLSLKGGIGVGLLTRQQSFYLSNDEAEIAPVSTEVYTKIMYNGILRAGLHYNFTPQLGIDIVPFTRLNINNMTNKNATFQQRYSNVGLQLGVNYKL